MIMKEIKVFLRIGRSPHPIYYDLIDYPPKGVNFVYDPIIRFPSTEKASLLHRAKVKVWSYYIKNRPQIISVNKKECDLIHSTNNILISNKDPWIMDIENVWGLASFKPKNLKGPYWDKVISVLSSEECKALLPLTDAAKQSVISAGGSHLEDKMTVMYSARKAVAPFKKPHNNIPIIMWAGRRYYEKGGKTVMDVYDKIDGKAEFKLLMVGDVPQEVKEKYKNRDNVEFLGTGMTYWDKIKQADILLYPTNLDSYGLAMIDAMNHYVPVISSDMFSAPEIVQDGKTGFVVTHPMKWHDESFVITYPTFEEFISKLKDFHNEAYISDLAEKVMKLLSNEKLRKKMGNAGRELVEKGKFSIDARNKILRKVYDQSL